MQELSEIDEDMIYIFGNDWRDIIYNEYRFSTLYASNPVGIAYHVYLSHKGYVAPRFPRYEAAGEDSYLRNLRGLRVIEKNMQKAHPDLNLKFIVCPCSSLDLTYKDDLRVCHVVWEHEVDKSNRAYVRRLRNLSDIEL